MRWERKATIGIGKKVKFVADVKLDVYDNQIDADRGKGDLEDIKQGTIAEVIDNSNVEFIGVKLPDGGVAYPKYEMVQES